MSPVYLIMGVSGCGKTTVGKLLADKLSIPFYDADDFHPQSNIDKMARGTALDDEDRWPWLEQLAKQIKEWENEKGAVLACSALKEIYREHLFSYSAFAKAKQHLIYLEASYDIIANRLKHRQNHFFDPSLLESQFATLEVPGYGLRVDAGLEKEDIVLRILDHLKDA